MEKFSRFTDSSIGVNPFTQQPYRPSFQDTFFGYALLVIRLPFLIALSLLYITLDYLVYALPSLLALPLRYFFLRPLARSLLFCLGFYSLNATHLPRSHTGGGGSGKDGGGSGKDVTSRQKRDKRTLIISNMCGFIDVLVWTALVAPQYTSFNDDGVFYGETNFEKFAHIARLGASITLPKEDKSANSKSDVNRNWLQRETLQGRFSPPLLIQLEGAMSNNKSILDFHPPAIASIASIFDSVYTECAVLRYSAANTSVSPCFVSGDAFSKFIVIAMQFQNSAQIIWVHEEDIQEIGANGANAWGVSIRDSLCKALKVKAVKGLGRDSHRDFVVASSKR
jgi:hypothetical protein